MNTQKATLRRIISVLLCCVLLCTMIVIPMAANATHGSENVVITMVVPEVGPNAATGTTFEVNVNISGVIDLMLGADIKVYYDTDRFAPVSVVKAPGIIHSLTTNVIGTDTNKEGLAYASYVIVDSIGEIYNGGLFTLTFRVKNAAAATTAPFTIVNDGIGGESGYSMIATTAVVLPSVAAPVINLIPVLGGYNVSFSCATSGAQIYYTTDGTPATTASTLYTGTTLTFVTPGTVFNAIAVFPYRETGTASAVTVPAVTTLTAPVIDVVDVIGGKILSITAESGATIRYTTDGSAPTTSSLVYNAGAADNLKTVSNSNGIRAIATRAGSITSAEGTYGAYVVDVLPQPTIVYDNGNAYIETSAGYIAYTINGATPTAPSTMTGNEINYIEVPVNTSTTIKAIAYDMGYATSAVVTKNILEIDISGIGYNKDDLGYYLSNVPAGATVYYTTDGSNPTTRSSVYGSRILTTARYIKVMITLPGYINSGIITIDTQSASIGRPSAHLDLSGPGIKVVYRNKLIIFDVQPFIKNGYTLVPIRQIAEALECKVSYDQKTGKILISKTGKSVILYVNNNQATVNGIKYTLQMPATVVSGRTFVPIRFVSQAFGKNVNWSPTQKLITILD